MCTRCNGRGLDPDSDDYVPLICGECHGKLYKGADERTDLNTVINALQALANVPQYKNQATHAAIALARIVRPGINP